jgi:tetratricopeptide (TPR) repeat protein
MLMREIRKMRKIICLSVLIFFCVSWPAKSEADWGKKIYALLDKGDTQQALKLLEEWKANHGEDDPQYWVAGGNIWAHIAVAPTLEISAAPFDQDKDGEAIVLTNPQTGKVAGKIVEGPPIIKNEDMKKAVSFLDEGIRRNPYRLDIFTGRAHLYRTMGDLKGELAALESLVKEPKPKNNGFEEGPGNKLQEPIEEYQLDMLTAYAREHLEKRDKTNDEAGKAVAELIMKLFPKKPHGYNLMGALASYTNDWSLVKKWLLLALEQDPRDSLVVGNLGFCNERLGDIQSAIVQYRKIIELNNDPELVESAKAKLAKLKVK